MYNSNVPSRAELPSSKQLMRSTIIAAIVAAVLLITVVLPSEYGKDLTGVGRLLGLTEMGQIKTELAKEAAADAAAAEAERNAASAPSTAGTATTAPVAPAAPTPTPAPVAAAPSAAGAVWRDELDVSLKPGEGIEIKLVMKEGETATFAWAVEGGVVNYDTHGDGSGRSISYVKGRGVQADQGDLVAAFTGNHGWFWRNRGKADVKLTLKTGGQYSTLKRP